MSTAGFLIPKVNFVSVTLDGGSEIVKKTNEPHILDAQDESGPVPSVGFGLTPAKMKIELVLSIEVEFYGQTSCNMLSYFLLEDFTKYLKILVVQSTNENVTKDLTEEPKKYFNHSDVLLKGLYGKYGYNQDDKFDVALINFSNYEGNALDLDNNPLTDDRSNIEKKYDENGNLVYVFPYKLIFTIPEAIGGVNVNNLSYFTQAYIDVEEIFLDEGILNGWVDLPDNIIQNLTSGEVNGLNVIQGGSTNSFGQVFYESQFTESGQALPLSAISNPTISIWSMPTIRIANPTICTGPVHYHGPQSPGPNGYVGYMAGTPSDMGVPLISQTVFNGIIQDFREVIEIEKIDFNYSLFSNSWFNQNTIQSLYNNKKELD